MVTEDWVPAARVIERNGTAAPATERSNPLRRIEWVPLGDEYPGLEVKLWGNPPIPVLRPIEELQATDPVASMLLRLKTLVLAHRDADGQPWPHMLQDGFMPGPDTDEFWDIVPTDISVVCIRHLKEMEKKFSASVERIFAGSTDTSSDGTLPSEAGRPG